MLVPHSIKLDIITTQGKKCQLMVESTAGIHFIKRRAIEALCATECSGQDPQAVKKSLYFKLIHPATVRTLKDEATLFDEQITKDCDLLLVKKRLDESRFSRYGAAAAVREKSNSKAPDAAMIREATAKLVKKGAPSKTRETVSAEEFQRDLKRILVTLVESAQNILALNPEAAKIFKEAQEIMSQESVPDLPDISDEAITQLTDMGFTTTRAEAALRRCRLSVHAAMEWLLSNPEELSTPPTAYDASSVRYPPSQLVTPHSVESSSEDVIRVRQTSERAVGSDIPLHVASQSEARSSSAFSSTTSSSGHGVSIRRRPSRAQTIIESFRAYKRRKFKPNCLALSSLIDMGFDEADVLEALRVTDNNQEAACEWLLGDRSRESSADALEDGIDPSSSLYQAIITSPVVQLGLSNPRCLLAFLHMLENGANAMDWLKDPDVGPILMQISRIYTAEKSDCVFPGFTES